MNNMWVIKNTGTALECMRECLWSQCLKTCSRGWVGTFRDKYMYINWCLKISSRICPLAVWCRSLLRNHRAHARPVQYNDSTWYKYYHPCFCPGSPLVIDS